jgi:hypothetical protein
VVHRRFRSALPHGRIILGDIKSRILRAIPMADQGSRQGRRRRLDRASLLPTQTPLGHSNDEPGRLRRPIHLDGTSRLTLRPPKGSSPRCVCVFRFIAMAVRRHSMYRPRFVPVQDRYDAPAPDRMAKVCAGGWEGAPQHLIRLPPLADPSDACTHVVTVVGTLHGAGAARRWARRFADEIDTFDGHRLLSQPSRAQPTAGCVTRLGSALRSGPAQMRDSFNGQHRRLLVAIVIE